MLTRRHFGIHGGAALGGIWLLGACGRSEAMSAKRYFVPGGRIGFEKPSEIYVLNNSWTLLSSDHTLMVDVHETIRLGAYNDAYTWDKDERSRRVESDLTLPGFELRKFTDLRYGADPNYICETIVVRDQTWMGEIVVTTGDHGGRTKHPGGQAARWSPLIAKLFASIQVRPQLPVVDALGELGIGLDVSGLNPRLIGNKLILSLYTPRSAIEVMGQQQAAHHAERHFEFAGGAPCGPASN